MKRSLLIAIPMALLALTNCSKSDGGSSETPFVRPDIKYDYVKTMTSVDLNNFTEVFTFTYDEQNRIEKISNKYTENSTPTEEVYRYDYDDVNNTLDISINEYLNSSSTANITRTLSDISLNSDGTISSFRSGDFSTYTDYTFTYSDYYLTSFTTKGSTEASEELLLTWSNGNLTRIDIVDNDYEWYEYEYGSTIYYANLNFQFYFSDLIPSSFWGAESNIWGYKSLNTISKLWIYTKGTKFQLGMAEKGDADADDIVVMSYCYTFNYTFSGTKITKISIDGDISVDGSSMGSTYSAFQTYTFTYDE